MKTPLSVRGLIIPVVTAMAAIAIIALALMPEPKPPGALPDPIVREDDGSQPRPLNPAAPVPAPRP